MIIDINNIPNGESGSWKVEDFEVPKSSIENIRLSFQPGGRMVNPGKYKRLTRNNKTIMSNTPAEMRDQSHFIHKAKGRVLINGLGLGCVLAEVLKKDIESVTVIEASEDVIKLVAPFFKDDPRVEIIHTDAYEWKPPKGVRYNAVWHDIWDNLCADNLPEMAKLHRKYGKRTDWQGSWGKGLCLYYRSQEKRNRW